MFLENDLGMGARSGMNRRPPFLYLSKGRSAGKTADTD